MASNRNELSGRFTDNWRNRGGARSGEIDFIVGAIAFMADTQVAQVQLAALGYAPGVADGKLGAVTAAALKKFQLNEGLPQTGTVDAATKQRLYDRTAGMGLKLPGGTPISSLVQSPSNAAPSTSSDLLDQLKKDIGAYATPPPSAPTLDYPSATSPTPFPVPGGGVPEQGPSTMQPATKPDEEKKILGVPAKVVYGVAGVAVVAAAGLGIARYMNRDEAPTLRVPQRTTLVSGM